MFPALGYWFRAEFLLRLKYPAKNFNINNEIHLYPSSMSWLRHRIFQVPYFKRLRMLKCAFYSRRSHDLQPPTTKTSPPKAWSKHIVNVLKKDNGTRKVKKVAQSFAQAVKELKAPRTSESAILYPLDEIFFTALAAVIFGSESCYDFGG